MLDGSRKPNLLSTVISLLISESMPVLDCTQKSGHYSLSAACSPIFFPLLLQDLSKVYFNFGELASAARYPWNFLGLIMDSYGYSGNAAGPLISLKDCGY